ncbi:hypothetical protein Tco_0298358 [Tanacetum coccineum]
MSTAKAEYVSLSTCCAQVLWMRTQLTDYGFHFDKIPMYYDSKAAIAISCNPVQHSRIKHIDVRYHFIKELVERGIVELFFVEIEYQLVDLFTKALLEDRFKYLVRRLGKKDDSGTPLLFKSPFPTTAMAVLDCIDGRVTLRSGEHKEVSEVRTNKGKVVLGRMKKKVIENYSGDKVLGAKARELREVLFFSNAVCNSTLEKPLDMGTSRNTKG